MRTLEPSFDRLVADPDVVEIHVPGGPVGVFAPHGGGIEPGTEEIAAALARLTGATLYVLAGRRARGNGALHVTSTGMRAGVSKKLDAALAACRVAFAIHGHGRVDAARVIYLSGRAARPAAFTAAALRGAFLGRFEVVDEAPAIPRELAGTSIENFVNRPAGGGVQIELPRALRDEARGGIRGDALRLVRALAGVIEEIRQ